MTREAPDPLRRPVVFGEVLHDCFTDGTAVLGGAPYNVAWHLKGLGLDPLLVSRVGADARGENVRSAMHDAGLDPAGLQTDPDLPTGEVAVSLRGGHPRFDIAPDRAYDAVDDADAVAAVTGIDGLLLYHGTLALRSPKNREALAAVRRAARLPVFLDVNLRDPWWTPETVEHALQEARWVKLNDQELRELTGCGDRLEEAARDLAGRCRLAAVIVTRGERGAFWATASGAPTAVPAAPVPLLIDSVGAGDAFAAACIAGIAEDRSPEDLMRRAARVAAGVCAHRGAIPADIRFHSRVLAPEG